MNNQLSQVVDFIFTTFNSVLNVISEHYILRLALFVPIVCGLIYLVYELFLDSSGSLFGKSEVAGINKLPLFSFKASRAFGSVRTIGIQEASRFAIKQANNKKKKKQQEEEKAKKEAEKQQREAEKQQEKEDNAFNLTKVYSYRKVNGKLITTVRTVNERLGKVVGHIEYEKPIKQNENQSNTYNYSYVNHDNLNIDYDD